MTTISTLRSNIKVVMILSRLSGDMEPGERLHIVREMERNIKVEGDKNIFIVICLVLFFRDTDHCIGSCLKPGQIWSTKERIGDKLQF